MWRRADRRLVPRSHARSSRTLRPPPRDTARTSPRREPDSPTRWGRHCRARHAARDKRCTSPQEWRPAMMRPWRAPPPCRTARPSRDTNCIGRRHSRDASVTADPSWRGYRDYRDRRRSSVLLFAARSGPRRARRAARSASAPRGTNRNCAWDPTHHPSRANAPNGSSGIRASGARCGRVRGPEPRRIRGSPSSVRHRGARTAEGAVRCRRRARSSPSGVLAGSMVFVPPDPHDVVPRRGLMAGEALCHRGVRPSRDALRDHREMLHQMTGRRLMALDTVPATCRRMDEPRDLPRARDVTRLAVVAEVRTMRIDARVAGGTVQWLTAALQQRRVIHRDRTNARATVLHVATAAGADGRVEPRRLPAEDGRTARMARDAGRPGHPRRRRVTRGAVVTEECVWGRELPRTREPTDRGPLPRSRQSPAEGGEDDRERREE